MDLTKTVRYDFTIDFYLTPREIKSAHRVFEMKENPGFTIISQKPEGDGEYTWLTVYFESSITLWYFVTMVEHDVAFLMEIERKHEQLLVDLSKINEENNKK